MNQEPVDLGSPSQHAKSRPLFEWMRHTLGLDRAILFTIFGRGWSSIAGLVTVTLIARFLSPAEQGYYYTFGSLVALQIVFELGFSYVILQMASHERAHLSISSDNIVTGDVVAHGRLASVLQKAVRWYSVAAVLMAIVLVPTGMAFFNSHQHSSQSVSWRFPWCFAVLAASLNFQLDPLLSFLEGCGFVANVARLRFVQAVVGSLLAWAVLITNNGLFAPGMVLSGTALTAAVWLLGKRKLLFGLMRFQPGANRIQWRTEAWHFQWKIAVSWICGYFIFQLFNPVLFAFRGPISAGQMGMSLSLASALQSVSISWINTKSAPFGSMIARKEYARLDQVFFKALKQSLAVCIVGAFAIWIGSVYLNHENIPFAHRLLSPLPLGFLLVATMLNSIVSAEALYLRAHKQEKFLLNSVLGALLIASSTYWFGKLFGAIGMVSGYLAVVVLMGLPLGTFTFFKYRKIWHEG